MRRYGHSLLETLVALAIMATLVTLLFPALQRVRASADRTACANNLRQIGLAVQEYYDAQKVLPYTRLCPAPWRGGRDPFCTTLPTSSTYTGLNETWWAPY